MPSANSEPISSNLGLVPPTASHNPAYNPALVLFKVIYHLWRIQELDPRYPVRIQSIAYSYENVIRTYHLRSPLGWLIVQ
jgi:hypothetical protein